MQLLKNIQQEVGITFVYVTHDQEEALTMSDTIVVMNEGQIQQIGSPTDIYNEPENRFVAQFIGESNIIEGIFIEDYLVEFDGQCFECVDKGFDEGQEVDIVLRPEDLDIVDVGKGKIEGVVTSIVFKGVHYEIMVKAKNRNYKVHTTDISEVGLLSKLNLDDGCIRYEIRLNKDEKHNHHHLICEKCGKIIETKEDLLDGIEELIREQYKFNVSDHDIKFFGICEDCWIPRLIHHHD